jgi:hypothetical protein
VLGRQVLKHLIKPVFVIANLRPSLVTRVMLWLLVLFAKLSRLGAR